MRGGELLAECEETAPLSPSAAVRFLTGFVVEDERRRHSLFRDVASTPRSDIEVRPEPAAIRPLDHMGSYGVLVEVAARLMKPERADRWELRRLAPGADGRDRHNDVATPRRPDAMDTEKHIAILIDQAGQMKGSNAATAASSERFEDRREFG